VNNYCQGSVLRHATFMPLMLSLSEEAIRHIYLTASG